MQAKKNCLVVVILNSLAMLCYVFSTSEGLIWSNRCCAFPSEGVRLKPGHKGETVSELPASQASTSVIVVVVSSLSKQAVSPNLEPQLRRVII